jgi:hypothetical protein
MTVTAIAGRGALVGALVQAPIPRRAPKAAKATFVARRLYDKRFIWTK